MIVVDSSAICAIVFREPEREPFLLAISNADQAVMSSVIVFECRIVIGARQGGPGLDTLDSFLHVARIAVSPFDEASALDAHRAYLRYGRGAGSGANLNLADCAAYALAKAHNAPLLFKGGDFDKTDIVPAA